MFRNAKRQSFLQNKIAATQKIQAEDYPGPPGIVVLLLLFLFVLSNTYLWRKFQDEVCG